MLTNDVEVLSDFELSQTTGGIDESSRPGAMAEKLVSGIGDLFSSAWNSMPDAPQGLKDRAQSVKDGARKMSTDAGRYFMGSAAGRYGF